MRQQKWRREKAAWTVSGLTATPAFAQTAPPEPSASARDSPHPIRLQRSSAKDSFILQIEVPAPPRKRPRQARSIALVDAVKKAGREILEKEGRAALSLGRISERAGVATSSIYEYFPTIEALIQAIYEDYRTTARQNLMARIHALPASATLFDGILLMMRGGLGTLSKWSKLDPEVSIKAMHYDELVRLDLVKPENFLSAVVIPALLERFSSEIRVRDRRKAQFLAYQTVLALPRALMLERTEYLDEADTANLIARMLHGLLTAEAAQETGEDPEHNQKTQKFPFESSH